MTTSEKMTNRKAIQFVLDNCDVPADVRAKFEAMAVAIDKKNGAERKPSARQIENEGIKSAILAEMEVNHLYTIQEMLKGFTCFGEGMTSQRVSALMAQLVEAGKVVRTIDKRKTYFSLV